MNPKYCDEFWRLYDALALARNEHARQLETCVAGHGARVMIETYNDASTAVTLAETAMREHRRTCRECKP